MRNKLLFSSILLAASVSLSAQQSATITLHADQGKQIIPKGSMGSIPDASPIPNTFWPVICQCTNPARVVR